MMLTTDQTQDSSIDKENKVTVTVMKKNNEIMVYFLRGSSTRGRKHSSQANFYKWADYSLVAEIMRKSYLTLEELANGRAELHKRLLKNKRIPKHIRSRSKPAPNIWEDIGIMISRADEQKDYYKVYNPGELTLPVKVDPCWGKILTSQNLKEYAKEIQEMNLQPGDKIRNKVTNDQFIVSKVLENFVVETHRIESDGSSGDPHHLVWDQLLLSYGFKPSEEWKIDENYLFSKEYFEVI